MKIMLVHESPDRAEVLRHALASAGHDVTSHAASAVDLHRDVCRLQPEIIIIDTQSPDRDTLENLCVLSETMPRPVVMFSHDDDSLKIREAVRAGVAAYVVNGLAANRVQPILELAVARFDSLQSLKLELAQANTKLEERKLVERAKGILMKSRGLSEDEAFRLLRKQAMERSQKLADVARQVIAVADLLAG